MIAAVPGSQIRKVDQINACNANAITAAIGVKNPKQSDSAANSDAPAIHAAGPW